MSDLSIISMQTTSIGDYIAIENLDYYKEEYIKQYKGKSY
jgi:hypothetical protein